MILWKPIFVYQVIILKLISYLQMVPVVSVFNLKIVSLRMDKLVGHLIGFRSKKG